MYSKEHMLRAAILVSALVCSFILQTSEGNVINNEVGGLHRRTQMQKKDSANAVDMSKLRFQRLPCSCQTKECGCCATIQAQRFNFSQRGCLNFSVDPSELSMMMDVYLNNKSVYRQKVSGRNPPPICVPLPQFPLLMLCARLYDIRLEGNNVHACVNLEAQLQGTPLLVISFDCIRFGADGFAVVKPQLSTSVKVTTEPPLAGEDDVEEESGPTTLRLEEFASSTLRLGE